MFRIYIIGAFILTFSMIACGQGKVKSKAFDVTLDGLLSHNVKEISVNQVDSIKNIVFLDSRSKAEYQVSHLKNAIWVGYDDFNINRLKNIPKDASIVVYCSVGYRSEKITQKLIKAGYTNASNLYGGAFEWKNRGRAMYNFNGLTDTIHAYNAVWGIWLDKGIKVYGDKTTK